MLTLFGDCKQVANLKLKQDVMQESGLGKLCLGVVKSLLNFRGDVDRESRQEILATFADIDKKETKKKRQKTTDRRLRFSVLRGHGIKVWRIS